MKFALNCEKHDGPFSIMESFFNDLEKGFLQLFLL